MACLSAGAPVPALPDLSRRCPRGPVALGRCGAALLPSTLCCQAACRLQSLARQEARLITFHHPCMHSLLGLPPVGCRPGLHLRRHELTAAFGVPPNRLRPHVHATVPAGARTARLRASGLLRRRLSGRPAARATRPRAAGARPWRSPQARPCLPAGACIAPGVPCSNWLVLCPLACVSVKH